MNIKRFTLLSLSAVILAGGVSLLQSNKEVKYFPRDTTALNDESAQGYLEYIQSIKANQNTGEVNPEDVFLGEKQADKLRKAKSSLGINWSFKGPDNVGGRTRAFIIDKNDSDHLLAGGVAGGVFESFDQGQTWNVYDVDYKVKNISCITQGADGSFYVGTGGHFEVGANGGRGYFFVGSGIHKLTGGGNFELIVGPKSRLNNSINWATVGQIAADPNDANILYAAMNDGVRKIDMSGIEPEVTDPIGKDDSANDVDITDDGKIIFSYRDGQVYTSHDNGKNFVLNSFPNTRRLEVSFAPSNSNIVYAAAVSNNSCLFGIFRSSNGGISWDRISPATSSTFDMFRSGSRCQGFWDNTIAVYPNDPGKILVGGIVLYRWEQSSVDPAPPNGSWNQIDVLFNRTAAGVRIPNYIHADKHRITFDEKNDGVAYIASDGGISKSVNIGDQNPTYNTFNFNFRVTQFYNIAVNSNDIALGGTQDNSGHLVGLQFNNNLGSIEVFSGFDGFDAELSTVNPSIGFATAQNGRVRRVQGIGTTPGNSNLSEADIVSGNPFLGGLCNTPEGCNEVFYTVTELWESFKHEGSQDLVSIQITEKLLPPMEPNRKIKYNSNNSSNAREIEFTYTVANNNSQISALHPKDSANYRLDGNGQYRIFPSDTLFGLGADKTISRLLEDPSDFTVIANFDTLVVDTASMVVTINHPSGNVENLPYTLGTNINYTNEFYGPIYFSVENETVNGVDIPKINYFDIQISFFYVLEFIDSVQTIFATANWPGAGSTYDQRNIYITRDAMKNSPSIKYYSIAGNKSTPDKLLNNDNVLCMEISKDGNYMFVGTRQGRLYRISDLNLLTNDSTISEFGSQYLIQQTVLANKCHKIGKFNGRAVTDIALDPNNPDNLIVSLGNYGNGRFIAKTNVATTTLDSISSFTFVQGVGSTQLPRVPAYTVLYDARDTSGNTVIVGSELGVFATENINETSTAIDTVITPADTTIRTMDTVRTVNNTIHTFVSNLITPEDSLVIPNDTTIVFPADTQFIVSLNTPDTTIILGRTDVTTGVDVEWTEESVGMGRVPVFALEQMRHPWPYASNTGKIYAGTHGRGVFELSNFVGIGEVNHFEAKEGFKESLKFYPNPVRDNARIEFVLAERGTVEVQVFDIRGKLVKTQQLSSLNKGTNGVTLNFNELVNGTYIIRVINGSEVATNKFVLYK